MKFFQEVTEWNVGYSPNHIYYLSDDRRKMVAYIKAGSTDLIKFRKPMDFDVRGRKFVVLNKKGESDEVYFPKAEIKPSASTIEVEGSNGKKYSVSKVGSRWTCSCPGFQFRSKCKHADEQKMKNS